MGELNEVKRGRGRPVVGTQAINERLEIRINADEQEMLDRLMCNTGRSKSDIVRSAFRGYYAYLKEVGMIEE